MVLGCRPECDYSVKKPVGMGCGNFGLFDEFEIDGYDHSYLFIQVQKDDLDLNHQFKSFSISSNSSIYGTIESYNMPAPPYCDDAIPVERKLLHSWQLHSGTAQIRILENGNDCQTYIAELILTSAEFTDSTGNSILIESKYFERVVVGWYAG